jgi:hypothetical protein
MPESSEVCRGGGLAVFRTSDDGRGVATATAVAAGASESISRTVVIRVEVVRMEETSPSLWLSVYYKRKHLNFSISK